MLSSGQLLAARHEVAASKKPAVARAGLVARDAVAANPSACLRRVGVLSQSRTASVSRTGAERLRVRELVSGCLRDVENAARASRSVGATGSEA
jgi:hypothetical protein